MISSTLEFFRRFSKRISRSFNRGMMLLGISLLGWLCAVLCATLQIDRGFAAPPKSHGYGFELPSLAADQSVKVPDHTHDDIRVTVVCFLGTECPLAKLYGPRLQELSKKYQARGARFVGLFSNQQDSRADIQLYLRETGIAFAVAKDTDSLVANQYSAERTPEVFLLDSRLQILYRGRIDNQFQPGIARDRPTSHELETAIEESLAGKTVSISRADALGCRIGRVRPVDSNSQLTYSNGIAEILKRNCVECHRTGEIGPFALTDYSEIVGWGDAIVESIDAGRMPPWHASPAHGKFVNARHLSDKDKLSLRQWFAAGAPMGKAAEPSTASTAASVIVPFADVTLAMRPHPYRVPATGTVEYQYFVVDPKFDNDQWVSTVQIMPGNRAVVHHAIVFIRPPDGARFRGVGWLGAYVPGQRVVDFPAGHARMIPKGSKLVFQMHYTPNGTAQDDLTKIAMSFIPESQVTHEIFTLAALDQEFEIPPGSAKHSVDGQTDQLPVSGKLLSIEPHMHFRGSAFQVRARYSDKSNILLDVPRYDFNWQHSYVLAAPLSLADVRSLEFTATFDNSPANHFNPDPSQFVTWGDQTWEEMAICFFEVAEPRDSAPSPPTSNFARQQSTRSATRDDDASKQQRVRVFVDEFFSQLDKNQDGKLVPSESPLSVRHFSFRRFDADNNQIITREEVFDIARQFHGLP